jgi:hypothetical protein
MPGRAAEMLLLGECNKVFELPQEHVGYLARRALMRNAYHFTRSSAYWLSQPPVLTVEPPSPGAAFRPLG